MTQSAQGASIDSAPEVVGFRNQQRARWDALPVRQRAAISIALELLLAVLLFFVDHSLGYAVVVISRALLDSPPAADPVGARGTSRDRDRVPDHRPALAGRDVRDRVRHLLDPAATATLGAARRSRSS